LNVVVTALVAVVAAVPAAAVALSSL
jgi:hypothetical protein